MIFTSQLGTLDGKTDKEAIASVANHLRRMQEELEYRLAVLDSSNISEIDAGSTSILTPGGNLLNLLKDKDGNVSSLQQLADKIKLIVDKEGNVTAASIVAAINADESEVAITADHINLNGYVKIQAESNGYYADAGTVEIADGVVKGETIAGRKLGTVVSKFTDGNIVIAGEEIRFEDTDPTSPILNRQVISRIRAFYDDGEESAASLKIETNNNLYLAAVDSVQISSNNGFCVSDSQVSGSDYYYSNLEIYGGTIECRTNRDMLHIKCSNGFLGGSVAVHTLGGGYWIFGDGGLDYFDASGVFSGYLAMTQVQTM